MRVFRLSFFWFLKTVFSLSPVLALIFALNPFLFFGAAAVLFFNYLSFSLTVCENHLALKGGLLWRTQRKIPLSEISFFGVEKPFLLHGFGVRRVFIYLSFTKGFNLIVNKKCASFILEKMRSYKGVKPYSPKFKTRLIACLLFSNSLVGIAAISTSISFLRRILSFLGRDTKLPSGVTLSLSVIGAAAVLGWVVAFFINLLKYVNFFVHSRGEDVKIRYGLLTKHRVAFSVSNKVLGVRENLFSKIFNISSVFIKGENGVSYTLIPAISKRHLGDFLLQVVPQFKISPVTLHADYYAFLRVLIPPLCLCLGAVVLSRYLKLFFSLFVFSLFISVWHFAVEVINLFISGVGRNGEFFTFVYSKGLTFLSATVKCESIMFIHFRQSVFQRFSGNCDVVVSLMGNQKIRIKNLNYIKAKEFFKED